MSYAPINSESPYLPNTFRFGQDPEVLNRDLGRVYAAISYRLNNREISIYDLNERLTGQKWTDPNNLQIPKETYRKVLEITAIAPGGTLNIPHGINTISQFTNFYGAVITGADDRPVPYVDATLVTNQISVRRVGANIRIVNGPTAPAITSGLLVVEYLKN